MGFLEFWKNQRRFPLYSLPSDSLSAATAQLPVVIVASRFGEDAAGLLAMAIRMVGAPISLLSTSVLDVFKRQAGSAFRERGECRIEYIHAFRILFTAAFIFVAGVVYLSKPLFALFFHEKWVGAAAMCVSLLPRFAFGFVASPLSYVVYIVEKQQIDLLWQVAQACATAGVLLVFEPMPLALNIYAACSGLLYLVYMAITYTLCKGRVE
jgi:O-antigen/teichoic acid export membrane protein